MHRATPADTLHRAYNAGGSRATISAVDDNPLMQEMAGNFMKGETRSAIEAPQNYGFTSVVRDASKSGDGQLNECAEGFVSFMGGNRSFPICTIMDDRRYRLKELQKGDVAMFDYLQHQIHLNTDGVFVTGRTDKKMKFQLNPPPQDQSSSGGASAGTRATGGGSASTVDVVAGPGLDTGSAPAGNQASNQKTSKGQQKRYDQTSQKYLEVTNDTTNLVHDQNINHKSATHQFMTPDGASARAGGGPLVQIFGDKFTGGLGHFMKQVTAAPPIDPTHLATKGYIDSIISALGFTMPKLPALPMPPLPPGVTLPPGFTIPGLPSSTASEDSSPSEMAPPWIEDLMQRLSAIEARLDAFDERLSAIERGR
jgi:hypothetical protein